MLPASFTPSYLKRLELLKIRSRRSFLGSRQGGHVSLKRGHGIEFSDYRRYELGDNPRHIDWGLYGRSERLYVKRFQEEQDLRVLVIVDGSSSMGTSLSSPKWQRACELALSLAYVALMQHDKVYMGVPGLLQSPGRYGASAIHQFFADLSSLTPGSDHGEESFSAIRAMLSKMRFPGVAIFISDFLFSTDYLERVLNLLRAQNLDITCVQLNSPEEIDLSTLPENFVAIDSEDQTRLAIHQDRKLQDEYRYRVEQHFAAVRQMCASFSIAHAATLSTDGLEEFVFERVPRAGLLGGN